MHNLCVIEETPQHCAVGQRKASGDAERGGIVDVGAIAVQEGGLVGRSRIQ